MSELIDLLKEFDGPQIVEAACRAVFGQSRHFAVPAMIKDAVKRGYLVVMDDDGPVVDSPVIYGRDMMLTDSGRELCSLPPVELDTAKPPKSKKLSKPQMELF